MSAITSIKGASELLIHAVTARITSLDTQMNDLDEKLSNLDSEKDDLQEVLDMLTGLK